MDKNEEGWRREAGKVTRERLGKFPTYGESSGFYDGYLAACRDHAPRWVKIDGDEYEPLVLKGWEFIRNGKGGMVLLCPPTPDFED